MQDPILTPLLVGAGVTGTLTIGTASISAASLISTAITTTALVGASLLMVERPKLPTPQSGTVAFQQGIPSVIWGVGRVRLAGQRLFNEERNGNLYRVNGIANHRIAGIDGWYLGEDAVTLRADGVSVEPLGNGRYGYDREVVRLYSHLGGACKPGDPNPLQPIIDDFPGILTGQFRPDGVAVIASRYAGTRMRDFAAIYPGGATEPSAVARMALVWDLRDPEQDPEDIETWKWSANPVLIAIWYHCFCGHGDLYDYRMAVLPYADHLARQADICDELMPQAAGGTAPRYECHLWWQDEQDHDQVWTAIKASCDGWLEILPDGGLAFWVGHDETAEPEVWISDDDIAGCELHAGVLDADLVNIIIAKYTDPQSAYQAIETDAIRFEDSIMLHGVHDASPDLWQVQNLLQARTLASKLGHRANPTLIGSLFGNLGMLRVIGYRWIGIRSTRFPELDGKKAERWDSLSIDLPGASASQNIRILDWEAMAALPSEGTRHTAAARPNSDVLPVPEIRGAAAEAVALASGQSGVRVDVRVADLGRDDLGLVLQWRESGSDLWDSRVYGNLPDDPAGGEYVLSTGMLRIDAAYDVVVASLGGGGSWGVPAPSVMVSTSSAVIAPASPVIRSGTGGTGVATLRVRAPTSGNLASVTIWRALSGNPFGSAVQVGASISDPSLGELLTITDMIAAGTYDYWATAANDDGYSSTQAGPVTVTVS